MKDFYCLFYRCLIWKITDEKENFLIFLKQVSSTLFTNSILVELLDLWWKSKKFDMYWILSNENAVQSLFDIERIIVFKGFFISKDVEYAFTGTFLNLLMTFSRLNDIFSSFVSENVFRNKLIQFFKIHNQSHFFCLTRSIFNFCNHRDICCAKSLLYNSNFQWSC